MIKKRQFAIVGIPLSRPEIVDFLVPPQPKARGSKITIVGQRPSPTTEAKWIKHLAETAVPTVEDLLQIDDPHGHLVERATDRLVPVEFLAEPDFLTRDLGGWVSNYFGTIGYEPPLANGDPLLNRAEILRDFGSQIRFFGADPHQVAKRLEEETGMGIEAIVQAFCRLHTIRQHHLGQRPTLPTHMAYIDRLYTEIAEECSFAAKDQPAIPNHILLDELLGQLVILELLRRTAVADQNHSVSDVIAAWQETHKQASGLQLLLKGEYIIGRHRRSTILIAPELGVVVKQPAPEPFHEIELGARMVNGRPENWPVMTEDGALVTARGRLRLILEENLVPRISRAFGYNTQFSSLLGLTIEPFIQGDTVLEAVWGNAARLTPALYEEIVLHQLVCEQLGIENGDWHAANFIVRQPDGAIVHVDWGAARPLRPDERTPGGESARLHQVRNIAFSFKHPPLVARVEQLHDALTRDDGRVAALQTRAQELSKK
ncbi:MAG: hypothetical protein CL608_04390 [Anaerolineaceae bacterium]|nr:hypothetical protein [Anaerolineaceae bacterium]